MSAGSTAAADGVVFGLAAAFLGQQLGYLDLSGLYYGLATMVVFALVFGILFGVAGAAIGRRFARRHVVPAPEGSSVEDPPKP